MPSKKALYLGKCLGDLHTLSEIKPLGNNVNIIIKSSSKVFQDAETFDTQGDEERAFVMYLKYFNILKQVKTKADYKKQKDYFDNLIGKKNQIKAIERAEQLSESLKERYDLKEAEAVAKKLASLDSNLTATKSPEKKETVEKAEVKTEEKAPAVVSPSHSVGAIKCIDLCELLRDPNTKLILMDVRSGTDFHQSHISHTECISVPEEIIAPGSTVNHIQSKLSEDSKTVWMQRKNADHIVLLDWKSTIEKVTIGTPLRTLKDALFKFDTSTIIKSEPLILEGGYEQWLLFYPTLTTNAHVARPSDSSQAQPPSPTMTLDFDYPDLDDNLQKGTGSPSVNQTLSPNTDNVMATPTPTTAYAGASVPRVDRSLKPSLSIDSSSSSSTSMEIGRESGLNNAQITASSSNSSLSASSLYPSVSAAAKSTKHTAEKNTNILNDRTSGGRKNINLSIKNNLASDLSQSVERREEKEAELRDFQKSRDSTLKEDQHRLEEAEKKLRDLENMKKKEEKDVADLMRMKRKLKEELEEERRRQEEERQRLADEEEKRLVALEQAKREEEEKKRRIEEVERMRLDRKRDEQQKDMARKQQEEDERIKKEAEEKAAQQKLEEEEREKERLREAAAAKAKREEEEKELQRRLDEEKQKEEAQKEILRKQKEAERQRQEAEEAKRLKEEQEEAARKEEERKQKEIIEREVQRKQREEQERKRKEEAARERVQREREAAEKAMQMKVTEQPPSKMVPSNMLPVGWEKRLDRATNRYFYIDHNRGVTQWVPPSVPASARPPDTYITKLKEEPSVTSSRGMSRSHSSPDIKKQLEEEEERARKPLPSVDRGNKPSPVKIMPKQTAYVVRKRDLNPVYGNVGAGLTGLRNLGNTCYMNSTVQCLSNTSPLISYFLKDSYLHDINRESSQGMHGEVVDDFAVVIKALWSQQYRSITPRDLKSVVGKYNPMFAGYQQQDSQEFLTFLLDGLHEGLNEVKTAPDIPEQNNDNLTDRDGARIAWQHHKLLHKSIIVELFQGQLKSSLMCRTCRKTSVTFQAFMFLSLPIPASSRCSLKDCIQEFLKPEMMTGSSKWKCPRCKVERDSEKKIDIWKLPPILLVGLNRFYSDGMWMQKKTTYVDFPVTDLDFAPYIIGPPPRNRYNLYGISNHYGTMEGGHYTAFCRNPGNKKWYKFDDQDVYEMSRSDVKTSAAFVLYYTSIEMPAPQYLPHL